MNKTKLSIILDTFLISISISILLFVFFNNYIKNAKICLFLCILIYICLFFVIFKHFNNKFNLNKIKLFEEKTASQYLNFLTYTSQDFDINYYSNLLSSKHIIDNIYENDKTYFYINLKTTLNDFAFKFINDFYASNKNKPFIIINKSCSDDFLNLINNSPVKYILINYLELYNLMKIKNYFPAKLEKQNRFYKLNKFKLKSKQSLNSKNFFKFFISGICLILFSIFIPFAKYYMFFGSFLLILSIISLFNKISSKNDKFDLVSIIKKTDTK